MREDVKRELIDRALEFNNPKYFEQDPISFPRAMMLRGQSLRSIEIAAVFAAHFAWGRRAMIVRDCERFFDFMQWNPEDYVMSGEYRDDPVSIHRTIKWSDTAQICKNLRDLYSRGGLRSLEELSASQIRTLVYGQKEDPKAANKKINMMRRWMVRDDGLVDLGLWKNTPKTDLIIPLDVHVYNQALELGLTDRKTHDINTAMQITDAFREIFPDDPALGDFALFGYGVTHNA